MSEFVHAVVGVWFYLHRFNVWLMTAINPAYCMFFGGCSIQTHSHHVFQCNKSASLYKTNGIFRERRGGGSLISTSKYQQQKKNTKYIKSESDKRKMETVVSEECRSMAHHPARVWLHCLQLLKLFNLALIHVVLQLPGAILVRQRAPLDQVVHHLLQQAQRN